MEIDPTLRGKTTQDVILKAIAARLRSQLDGYTEQNCFEADQPFPLTHPGGDEICTVSIGGGNFDSQMWEGGGTDTLVDHGTIIVCPIIAARSRRPKNVAKQLYDGSESLVNRKHQVLKALLDPTWEPYDENTGQPYLRDLLAPNGYTSPQEVHIGEAKYIAMQVTFSTVFDWDLE